MAHLQLIDLPNLKMLMFIDVPWPCSFTRGYNLSISIAGWIYEPAWRATEPFVGWWYCASLIQSMACKKGQKPGNMGVPLDSWTLIAGWFMSWKIPPRNGWLRGTPMTQATPKWVKARQNHTSDRSYPCSGLINSGFVLWGLAHDLESAHTWKFRIFLVHTPCHILWIEDILH